MSPTTLLAPAAIRGTLVELLPQGRLCVVLADGTEFVCDWLESAPNVGLRLAIGDALLVLPGPAGSNTGIALGRIGRYTVPEPPAELTLSATQSLSLQCGESSLTLRADGQVLLKGEDVQVRAKGTHRIRAGNVAIN